MSTSAPEAVAGVAPEVGAGGDSDSNAGRAAAALPSTAAVATFVRATLGCQCPAALFTEIWVCRPGPGLLELGVGGRLLVHIRSAVDSDLVAAVQQWTHGGLAARDQRGYHRFRLVLTGPDPQALAAAVGPAFAAASGADPCAHLHCLPVGALDALLAAPADPAARPAP